MPNDRYRLKFLENQAEGTSLGLSMHNLKLGYHRTAGDGFRGARFSNEVVDIIVDAALRIGHAVNAIRNYGYIAGPNWYFSVRAGDVQDIGRLSQA